MKKPTKKQWAKWLAHKSNKERYLEEQERLEELKEEKICNWTSLKTENK